MTSPSSFNVSGLLGSNSIDTSTLISQLMQAAAIPQTQLKTQLNAEQGLLTALQAINTKTAAVQSAVQAVTDPAAWTATTATSSSTAVIATSDGTASVGTATFSVTQIAKGQISTVVADASGNVVADPSLGITVNGVTINNLASGSAADVAAAINTANAGVRASVVNTTSGQVLQMASTTTGASSTFTATGFQSSVQTVVAAQDAQITVGDPAAGGYTVTRPTNTFTDVIPGVTFSVAAPATDVSITVSADQQSISDKVKALVSAANVALGEIKMDTAKGAILQGNYEANTLAQDLMFAVSKGTATGGSLKTYGIDMDSNGNLSFNATAFAQAFAADPAGTKDAIVNGFAKNLNAAVTAAIAPVTGSITASITSATSLTDDLNKRIDDWTTRLTDIQTNLQTKYAAMNSMLASLQSQSTYLTNMLKSMSGSGSGSS